MNNVKLSRGGCIGFDQHNLLVTGKKAMSILNARSDGHSVPVVLIRRSEACTRSNK